jgi:multidrug efflux system membrane fusion protein
MKRHMIRSSRLIGALVVGVSIATAGCSGGEAVQTTPPSSGRGGGQNPAVPVTAAAAQQKSMPFDVEAIGTVIAASTVAVRAQITGELTSVNFKEGDEVQQGQVLFTLDKRPLEAALHQAEATMARDVAQAENANAQAVRYQDLLQRGIATREQIDQIKSQAAALAATVGADRAAIESAKVQLDYATITAPISGRTGLLQVHRGNLVRANDTMPIISLNRITPVYVTFAIPESMLPQFKHYMAAGTIHVEAKPPAEAGSASIGKIDFIDNAVDATTGTIRAGSRARLSTSSRPTRPWSCGRSP